MSPPRKKKKSSGAADGAKSAYRGKEQSPAGAVRVRKAADGAWEIVHPRCARDRREDLEEVRKMLDAGEIEIARDECRWLLNGCSDCLDAHLVLGEIALGENDVPLARGHFGYAYHVGIKALERAACTGPLPYNIEANRSFHEAGKGLAWCLKQLDKPQMVADVVATLLRCDPGDPLGVGGLLSS